MSRSIIYKLPSSPSSGEVKPSFIKRNIVQQYNRQSDTRTSDLSIDKYDNITVAYNVS
jgi:hypothetical protein